MSINIPRLMMKWMEIYMYSSLELASSESRVFFGPSPELVMERQTSQNPGQIPAEKTSLRRRFGAYPNLETRQTTRATGEAVLLQMTRICIPSFPKKAFRPQPLVEGGGSQAGEQSHVRPMSHLITGRFSPDSALESLFSPYYQQTSLGVTAPRP